MSSNKLSSDASSATDPVGVFRSDRLRLRAIESGHRRDVQVACANALARFLLVVLLVLLDNRVELLALIDRWAS